MKWLHRFIPPFLAIVCLLFSAVFWPADALAYTDVKEGEWFAGPVTELSAAGIVKGYQDGTFRPYQEVTRAQFAGMIHQTLELPAGSQEPFADVGPDDWFREAVAALYGEGLIQGVTADRFLPWEGVDRQASATLLVRALTFRLEQEPREGVDMLPLEQTQPWLFGFRDRWLITESHQAPVANAYRLGLVNGYEDGRFYPRFTLTRGQAAGLIYRAFFQDLAMRPTPPQKIEAEASYPTQSQGSSGRLVRWLEERLLEMRYLPGQVDGVFDAATKDAVIAFQKVEGLGRDGVVGPNTWQGLFGAGSPSPRIGGGGNRVEVDLTRQVLFLLNGGEIVKILPVSTGTTEWLTPTGHYHIQRKLPYWRQSELGLLYKPAYFVGGIAIHGSYSVPVYPASHGCVRVPYWTMDALYEQLPIGMTVDVYY